MTTKIDWPALAIALIPAIGKALADVQANKPLAPSTPMTGATIAAALPAIQADLASFAAKVKAYPGAITGIDDLLEAIEPQAPWAADVKAALDALPGGLAMVEQYLPTAISMLTMFSPAPGGQWPSDPNAI
jgi:hypothetical protein